MKNKITQNILIKILAFIALVSCKKEKSVNDLYKFPSTKDVLVLVNIDFTADANSNGGIDLTGKSFVLNAFALDAADKQVEIGLIAGRPVLNLPVPLTGSHTSFEAILRLPVDVRPRSTGYALRFELKQPSAALVLATPPSSLDALRGEIKAGTAASTNNVDLSLASSLAFQYLDASVENVGTVLSLGSYGELVGLFKAKQLTIEANVDVSLAHDIDSYVAAVLSGLNYQILTDSNFQKSLAEKLLLAVDNAASAAEKASAAERLAEGFTSKLISLTSYVSENLGDLSSNTGRVFTAGFIDPTLIPEPAAFANAVFAPLALEFVDLDASASLGGEVVITAPLLATGIASYNVYFGAEDKVGSKVLLLGNVLASASPLSIPVPTGTAQPSGVTRFWAYPVADGRELNIPASAGINNSGGINLAPPAPAGLIATGSGVINSVSWNPVAEADSYNLYWSTTSPVRSTSNRIRGVTSIYQHKFLLAGTTYFYRVTSVKAGIESSPSTEGSVTTGSGVVVPVGGTASNESPVPPVSGITVTNVTTTQATVSWSAASDDLTAGPLLQYKVVKAALASSLDSLAKVEVLTGASIVQDWSTNLLTKALTGLSSASTVYVAVLVKDEEGQIAFYPAVAVTTSSPSPKKIFVTVGGGGFSNLGLYNGDLGATLGQTPQQAADNACAVATNKPIGGGQFKALISIPSVRVACTSMSCSALDWPLVPNTDYFRGADNALIGTTNGYGVFDTLQVGFHSSARMVWTGLNADWSAKADDCSGWTTAGSVGISGGQGYTSLASDLAWNTNAVGCNQLASLICVEQ